MKTIITILLIVLSFSSIAQTKAIDSLKLTTEQAQAFEVIDKELKELQPVRIRLQSLEESKSKLIESALMWNNIKSKEYAYSNGKILYIRDEKKK